MVMGRMNGKEVFLWMRFMQKIRFDLTALKGQYHLIWLYTFFLCSPTVCKGLMSIKLDMVLDHCVKEAAPKWATELDSTCSWVAGENSHMLKMTHGCQKNTN